MDIEERVVRLERKNRLLSLAIFILVSLAALTGCLVMLSKITFGVIKAKQFQVIRGEDQVVAVMRGETSSIQGNVRQRFYTCHVEKRGKEIRRIDQVVAGLAGRVASIRSCGFETSVTQASGVYDT